MKPNSFERTAQLVLFNGFKERLKFLKKRHMEIKKKFDELCDELDERVINESYLYEITDKLTIFNSEMKIIEENIKNITESLKIIKAELCN